jgi:hypothetical protein
MDESLPEELFITKLETFMTHFKHLINIIDSPEMKNSDLEKIKLCNLYHATLIKQKMLRLLVVRDDIINTPLEDRIRNILLTFKLFIDAIDSRNMCSLALGEGIKRKENKKSKTRRNRRNRRKKRTRETRETRNRIK